MTKLNNWFIGLGKLSTNGFVWGDISGISGYSNGEIVDYSAVELPLPEGRGFLLLYTRKYTHVPIRSLN